MKKQADYPLEILSQDKRLSKVFQGKAGSCCLLQLWILDLLKGKTQAFHLLYGWIIPTPRIQKGWFTKDGGKKRNLLSGTEKYRVAKLTLIDCADNIHLLVEKLLQGMTLGEACQNVGIKQQAAEAYTQFKLVEHVDDLWKKFAVRPTIFQPSKDLISDFKFKTRPITSPSSRNPAFVGTLFCVNKTPFFSYDKEIIAYCLEELEKDTGLRFSDADSERIGNIEWFAFPSADENDNPYTNIKTNVADRLIDENAEDGRTARSCRSVTTEIRGDIFEKGTEILVRCRLSNGNAVISDQCNNIEIRDNTPVSMDFEAAEDVSEILLTIWKKEKGQNCWEIWHEDYTSLIRRIGSSIGIIEMEGNLGSPHLKKIAETNRGLIGRVKHSQKIKYISDALKNEIPGYPFDPWVPSARTAREIASQIFPKPSGGHFFAKGWYGEGRLSFIEWLQALDKSRPPEANKLYVFDPYFDESGVEIFARMESVSLECIVLTNTQALNDPQERIRRLKERCCELELLLNYTNFSLFDLRKQGKEKQVFHDRYILMTDQTGRILKGYHLSNSIQKATQNHPLLVTPVTDDLFDDLETYIGDLLDESKENREIVTIFSSLDRLDRLPEQTHFLSNLFQRYGAAFFESDEAYFARIIDHLKSLDTKDFRELWSALCEGLRSSQTWEQDFHTILNLMDGQFAKKIKAFLSGAYLEKPPFGTSGVKITPETGGILYLLRKNDFAKVLRHAGYYFTHPIQKHYALSGVLWSIRFLMKFDPDLLSEFFSDAVRFLSKFEENDLTPEVEALGILFQCVVTELAEALLEEDEELLKSFLHCDIPLGRAIAVQSLLVMPLESDNNHFKYAMTLLSELEREECLHALAEWGFKLRVIANQHNFQETEKLKRLRLDVFEEMKAIWPEQMTQEEIREIAACLSGPLEGAWASSTTNDLFIPLMDMKRLELRQIRELWFSILSEHLRGYFSEYADIPLISVCGWVLTYSSGEDYLSCMKELEEVIQTKQRILEKPFSQSLDYSAWDTARNALLWIQTLFKETKLYMLLETEKHPEFETIDAKIQEIEDALSPYNSHKITCKGLERFASEVQEHIENEIRRQL
ncbi:VPA1262 family protein [Desulfococcaceae bacterium HSG8]|nr:VPA1262 family protein [Desulfococcaceae bacterium HSG8]